MDAGPPHFGSNFTVHAPLISASGENFCALLAAVLPRLNQADARQLLCAGAEDEVGDDTDTPGYNLGYGWGRLNAFNSLRLATTRVDQVRRTAGGFELSWISPDNARQKLPYVVDSKLNVRTASWIPVNATNAFRYETNRVTWTDARPPPPAPANGRFYRVRLRAF